MYIDTAADLASLVSVMSKARRIAIDIEADSLHHYYEKVCLIQLTIDKGNYIVDPLAGLNLTEFLEVLSNSYLVLHDGGYDLRMMRSTFEFEPKGRVFDTMLAAKLLGYKHFGLGALVKEFADIELKKGAQKADWSYRPLSASLLKYASDDTRFLFGIADELAKKLKELDRKGWHKQTCKKMIASAALPAAVKDPEDEWRIKGISLLERNQLVYGKELFYWRQKYAQKNDRPPFKIMTNHLLLELAAWAQQHPDKPLSSGPKLPRDCRGSRLKALESAIKRAHKSSPEDWPSKRKSTPRRKHVPDCKALIQDMRDQSGQVAEKLGIDPSVLATRAALVSIAYNRPKTINEIMLSGPMMKWQAEILQPIIAENLDAHPLA
jgi:ribonuclease D